MTLAAISRASAAKARSAFRSVSRQWRRPAFAAKSGMSVESLESRVFLSAGVVRIASYNIEDDISGYTTPRPGLYQVLEGIGEEKVQGNVRPIDILGLEETTSNAVTVAPIVAALNSYYNGAAVYAQSAYQAAEEGGDAADGNGPNAMVYNTSTLNLLASVGVGTPEGSSNGEYRQVVRYEFQPVGDTGSTGIFYVYVSHMKSGSTSADATARGKEATIIRNDEATLPANSSVLYTGDLNSNPPEAEFTNFTAAGQGQAFDPVSFSTNTAYLSDSATSLYYRDDYQLMTSNVLNDGGALNYVSNSFHVFANNGSTPKNGSVNSGSDTALSSDLVQDGGPFITASTLYSDLTTASDHLPVVADYTITSSTGTPSIGSLSVNPTSVVAGNSVTLTAANVAEVGGTGSITGVNFYFESNGTPGLQIGSDTLLGAGSQNGSTWTLSASTSGLAAGTYTYYAVATDGAGTTAAASATNTVVVPAPPSLVGGVVGDGSVQRSTVSSINVTFSEPVNFSSLSYTLQTSQDDSTWTDVSSQVTASNPSGDGMTWVISCNPGGSLDRTAGQPAPMGFLANGIYQLTLHGAAITEAASNTLDYNKGADQIVPFAYGSAGATKNAFAVLYGDLYGSGVVNGADYLKFRNAFSSSLGQSAYLSALDWYDNGVINGSDYLKFCNDFNASYNFN